MSDVNQGGGQQLPAQTDPFGSFMKSPQLVYVLYLLGFVVAFSTLIGVVLAYINRDRASPLDRSHYDFQISTFWRGLVFIVAGIVLVFVVIGWLVLLFAAIWMIVRCVKGLNKYSQKEPMAADIGWGFG